MNIALTREERVLLWDLVGRRIDELKWDTESQWARDTVERLKTIEILIVG
jgi:hypothetical protein